METNELKEQFSKAFGASAQGVVYAPGRVNLIGEHTDYNNGFVLPIALKLCTRAAWSRREDGKVVFASLQQPAIVEVDLCEPVEKGEVKWANYPKGVLAGLLEKGLSISGCNILFDSNVPIGSGLSSSASLEVAAGLALQAASDCLGKVEGMELALLCQKAEHEYAGTPCGIMDQAISVLGKPNMALLLDCLDGSTKHIPFEVSDPSMELLVCDTEVTHALNDGGYAARRQCCEETAEILGIDSLREADMEMLTKARDEGKIDDLHFRRARHIVKASTRTLAAVDALESGDMDTFGKCMYDSHETMRDDYEISCEELDAIVEIASTCEGVYGARMTGGGFGGCAIVLVADDFADAATEAIQIGFEKRYGRKCPVFATKAAAGAGVIE